MAVGAAIHSTAVCFAAPRALPTLLFRNASEPGCAAEKRLAPRNNRTLTIQMPYNALRALERAATLLNYIHFFLFLFFKLLLYLPYNLRRPTAEDAFNWLQDLVNETGEENVSGASFSRHQQRALRLKIDTI